MELALCHIDLRQVLETGDDFRNRPSHFGVLLERLKVDGTVGQDAGGQVREDDAFGTHIGQPVNAAIRKSHEIEHRFLGGRLPFLVARRDRQDQTFGIIVPVDVPQIERCGQKKLESYGVKRPPGPCRIGGSAIEVAAHDDGGVHLAAMGGVQAGHGVQALGTAERNGKLALHFGHHILGQQWLDADGADALHIGVPAQRQQPGVGPPDHTAQQGEVGD